MADSTDRTGSDAAPLVHAVNVTKAFLPAMVVRGRLDRSEGVINVVADHLAPLPLAATTTSRDFR